MEQTIKFENLGSKPKLEKLDIASISTSSLVATVKHLNDGHCSEWQEKMMEKPDAEPCGLTLVAAIAELNKRRTFSGSYDDLNNTATKLAVTHVVKFSMDGKIGFLDDRKAAQQEDDAVMKTFQLGGYVCPVGNQEIRTKIEGTVIANAAYFPVVSTQCSAGEFGGVKTKGTILQHVDYSAAEELKLPLSEARLMKLPNCPRKALIEATAMAVVMKPEHREDIMSLMPDSVEFNVKKARFEFKDPEYKRKIMRPFVVKTCDDLYWLIFKWRAIRGTDRAPRYEVTSGYYYGLTSRSLYSVSYVVHDIIALGARLNVKVLEINSIDGVITSHVCHSLVAQGWIIRIVGASFYPKRKEESRGMFSYSPVSGRYLRFCANNEDQPSLVRGSLTQSVDILTAIDNAFKVGLDEYAIPFTYVYVQESLRNMPKDKFLFPTAHAHNGHVIVVKGTLSQDANYVFDFQKYLMRISQANTHKTFYYLTREPYWQIDPFGHRIDFYLRNRAEKADFMTVGRKLIQMEDETDDCRIELKVDEDHVEEIKIELPQLVQKMEDLKEQLLERYDVLEAQEENPDTDMTLAEIASTIESVGKKIQEEQEGRARNLVTTVVAHSMELVQNDEDEEVLPLASFVDTGTKPLGSRSKRADALLANRKKT